MIRWDKWQIIRERALTDIDNNDKRNLRDNRGKKSRARVNGYKKKRENQEKQHYEEINKKES